MQLKFLAVLVSSAVCSSLALAAVPNVSEATKKLQRKLLIPIR